MEPHKGAALQEIECDDLARRMRLGDPKGVAYTAQAFYIDGMFVLHNEDGLVKKLSEPSHDGPIRHTVLMPMPRTGAEDGEGAMLSQDDKFEFTVVLERSESVGRATEGSRLASRTREWLARVRPKPPLNIRNIGIGLAVFAAMSATSLVVWHPPLSYVLAAGALAPAGVMLARAAGKYD